ncbi:MAG: AAA family ATPase, partial [Actinocrinis sp.]
MILEFDEVLYGGRRRLHGLARRNPQSETGGSRMPQPLSALESGLVGAAQQLHRPASALVGRDRELSRLDAALERARAGRCVVLEVSGDPGMGKSSLLQAFADRAASRYMSVLTSRASRFEQARPYGLFADPIARADDLVRAHVDIGGGGSGVLDRPPPFDGAGAVANLIAASCDERGMLLCLDDLHWADVSSLSLLRRLLRDPPDVPMVVACAFRPRQAPALLVAYLRDIAERCGSERLDLAPLDRDASGALLGPGVEAPRLASLHQISGGNPLYLRILAALPEGPGSDQVARTAWSALLGELAVAEPEHVAALRAAALLGDPFDSALLPAAAGLDAEVAFGALDELAAADLV